MASNNKSTQAICTLCSQFFSDPRILPCLHSFCHDCLKKHFDAKKSDYLCPVCHEAFEVANGKIYTLPKDLHGGYVAEVASYEEKIASKSIVSCDRCVVSSESEAVKFCCDCCHFLCSWCTKDHARCKDTSKHELKDVGAVKESQLANLLSSIAPKRMYCQLHPHEILKFYCNSKDCCCLICCDCMVADHSGHTCDRVETVADKERESLLVSIQKADGAGCELKDAIGKSEKVIQSIKVNQDAADKKIKESFKELHAALTRREEYLLQKSAEVNLGKITALKLQGEEIKKLYDGLTRVCELGKEAAKSYSPEQMLSVKGSLTAKLKTIMKQFSECKLEPCKTEFLYSELDNSSITAEIEKYGTVTGGSYAAGSTASFFIPLAIKGKERTISVTTRDIQGRPFYQKGESVRARLGLISSNSLDEEGKVKDNGDGTYDISFTPQSIGEHQLNVTVGGELIKSSPFAISVREQRLYTSLSCQKTYNISHFPWGVAISDSEVFIVNYGQHCIQVMNKENGTAIRTIGTSGSYGTNSLQFYSPSAIAIQGNVMYIAEDSNHRIQKLTTSGKHLATFGSPGSGENQLLNPRGICIGLGKVYVTEYSNNRISLFQADGTFDGFITGNMSNPWGIAFDPAGNLNVANYGSSTISVFTVEGKFIRQYGSGILNYPAGIATDPEGYVFVSEYNYNRMLVLAPGYTLVKTIQEFSYPVGIAFDQDGFIYICNSNSCRVCKY